MEINFWTETSFEGADYDEATQSWRARIRRADGTTRTLRPKHIVMATSVSGTPNIPDHPDAGEVSPARCCIPASSTAAAEWARPLGVGDRHRHQRA